MTNQPYYPDYFNDSDKIPTVHGPDSDVYGDYVMPDGGIIRVHHEPSEPSGLGFCAIKIGSMSPGLLVSRLNQIPATWVKQGPVDEQPTGTSELKTFWKLICDGHGFYVDTAEGMAEFVRTALEEGDESTYTLEPVRLTQAEYDSLPEFAGF